MGLQTPFATGPALSEARESNGAALPLQESVADFGGLRGLFKAPQRLVQSCGGAREGNLATVGVKEAVRYLLEANRDFVRRSSPETFAPFLEFQSPRMTVLSCCDSRVQLNAFHPSPENDVFVIRNIGNQLVTAEGSVEYAVRHLRTPLLLILGHVRCGALHAAMGDFSKESSAVRRELETIRVRGGGDWLENVRSNVNDQVDAALQKFAPEIEKGTLVILGAVYDFANDLGRGFGKLVLTNIQGESKPEVVQAILDLHLPS